VSPAKGPGMLAVRLLGQSAISLSGFMVWPDDDPLFRILPDFSRTKNGRKIQKVDF